MIELTEKELLAIKAEHYLARNNSRLKHGGIYVENIHDYENCGKIPFVEAVEVVENLLYKTELKEGADNA